MGLFLLDVAVGIRLGDKPYPYPGIDFGAELNRLAHADGGYYTVLFFNIAVFVPFGFFLTEFLKEKKRISNKRIIGLAALGGFGLSLLIEFLQLFLKVGFFEFTDIVLNTSGAIIGAVLSLIVHRSERATDS